jgi:endonuclease YncB( thermonuclease family)
MNGEPVENRTAEGFFSVFAPLNATGATRLEFTQPGQPAVSRTITRRAPQQAVPPQPAPTTRLYGRDTPVYATVTAEVAWLFPRATATGGTSWLLERGMTDRVVATTSNGWA